MVSKSPHAPIGVLVTLALIFGVAGACVDWENPVEPPEDSGEESQLARSMDMALRCEADVKSGTFACGSPDQTRAMTGPQLGIVGGQGKYVLLCPDSDYPDLCPLDPNLSYAADTFRVDVTIMNMMDAPIGTPDGTTLTGIQIFFHNGPYAVRGAGEVRVCNADGADGTFTGSNQEYFEFSEILSRGESPVPKTWKFCLPSTVEAFWFEVYVHADMPPHLWFVQEPEDVHPELQVFAQGWPLCPIIVEARDASGSMLIEHSSDICLQIGENPGGSSLGGNVCGTPVDGRATFADITLDEIGSGYTLTANSDGVVQRESFSFTVSFPGDLNGDGRVNVLDLGILLGQWGRTGCLLADIDRDGRVGESDRIIWEENFSPSGLTFDSQPADAVSYNVFPAGYPICPPIRVIARDLVGDTLAAFEGQVSLDIGIDAGGGTIGNDGPESAVGGIAEFESVTISHVGDGYTLVASAAGVQVESEPFRISIPGDFQPDGYVDLLDLGALLGHWGQTADKDGVNGCHRYDIDGDGSVGISDHDILLENWWSVTTDSVSNVTSTSAVLWGTVVTSEQAEFSWWFEWGTDPTLADRTRTTGGSAPPNAFHMVVTENISPLLQATKYYFRLVGEDGGVRRVGETLEFTTLSPEL